MAETVSGKPGKLDVWVLAARPKTLPAATAPVIVGTALAIADGRFRWGPALAALLGALLLQIAANLANDVFDYHKGADTEQRLGPTRVTQAGLLPPHQVMIGMWVVFGLAALIGLYLTWAAGWPVVAIGLLSIAAAVAYTGGPFPLGYHGLGEIAVFIFFGLAAVCGTYYVQAQSLTLAVVLSAVPMGLLSSAILAVNNLRDIETDRAAGKHTLAARFGLRWARFEYLAYLAGAYLIPLIMIVLKLAPWTVLLTLGSVPLAVRLVRQVWGEQGRPLNAVLAGTGQLELVYALLLGLGLIIS